MKKILKYIVLLVSFALVVSCSKEIFEAERNDGLVEKTFSVEFAAAESTESTKAFLENGISPVWEVGETVSVYDPIQSKGCNFTVQSVENGKATISGSISEGDYPFSAVYPASAVSAWTDINTVSICVPGQQTVPSGRNIDPSALISKAYSDNSTQSIVFRNQVSLLKFKVETSGISGITLKLKNADKTELTYTVEGEFESGKYYFAAIEPGTYGGGISALCSSSFGQNWTKTSTKSLSVKQNGIKNLGTVSDGEKSIAYSITSERAISDLDAFLETKPFWTKLSPALKAAINAIKPLFFRWQNNTLQAYVYTHKSADPQGNPVTLSAIVYIPIDAISKGKKLEGVVIANHGTFTSDAERPTNTDDLEMMTAWKGYAVVLSDYCGLGADVAHAQAFLNPYVAARGTIDAYLAAMQIIKDMGISVGSDLYNVGYSQGAFNGMANIKYLSEHPEFGLKFTKSFLGGGPYDIETTWKAYLEGKYPSAVTFVPFTIISINECEKLGIPYNRLFKGALLENYQEWIFSKKYTRVQLDELIGTSAISDIITQETISSEGETNRMIMDVCKRFTLVSGWKPAKGNKIYIYHSSEDQTVPYSNYTSIKSFLDSVASDSTIKYQDGEDGGHMDAVGQWALMVMKNW